MDEHLITQAQQYFEAAWREPVQVTGMGRVTVGSRRDRRGKRERSAASENGPRGCLVEIGEFLVDVASTITWPFVTVWALFRLFKRDGPKRHAAIPSGPATGQAYRVAEALKQHPGEIAVVRGKTQLAIVELTGPGAQPTVVWSGRGTERPQWSPAPASLYWEDGSMLMLPAT
ncbi:hypothetical protein ATK30_0313 [Amycolatopsis echigonensis]|uniref:Uncharacterized protein n=1 Tax=Amycolatopsis echigonensis TaxID=2576905 RepID=A0A2N3X277_9PSEU|nr:hypothetical protein [Amycolatopsis niigatensis]PKW00223.1 hypothetical protein ATK30_0313 [Amycolatopsis niigatensis]